MFDFLFDLKGLIDSDAAIGVVVRIRVHRILQGLG